MRRLALPFGLLALTVAIVLAPAPQFPSATAGKPPVVLILMENHSIGSITASAAPYMASFAAHGRLFTNYYAIEHPSLPNYLDIVSGGNQGCTTDGCPRGQYGADNLFHQVGSWKSYEESMPSHCDPNSSGKYAVKHNPAVYFKDLASTCPNLDVAYPSTLPATLPAFTFITPNLCNDMHDCSVTTGDTWLSKKVPALLAKGAVVIITFDEGSGSNHVWTAERGPNVPVSKSSTAYNHYGLLAGLERYYGVPLLGKAGSATPLPVG